MQNNEKQASKQKEYSHQCGARAPHPSRSRWTCGRRRDAVVRGRNMVPGKFSAHGSGVNRGSPGWCEGLGVGRHN